MDGARGEEAVRNENCQFVENFGGEKITSGSLESIKDSLSDGNMMDRRNATSGLADSGAFF